MYKKTFVHLNPSTGVSVVVTATTTTYANKKEWLDFYMKSDPDNPLTNDVEKNYCDQINHNK